MFGKFHQVIVTIVKRPDLVTAMDVEYGQGSSTVLVGSRDAASRSHQPEQAKLVHLSARQERVVLAFVPTIEQLGYAFVLAVGTGLVSFEHFLESQLIVFNVSERSQRQLTDRWE
jgi:hypothetical protein